MGGREGGFIRGEVGADALVSEPYDTSVRVRLRRCAAVRVRVNVRNLRRITRELARMLNPTWTGYYNSACHDLRGHGYLGIDA